jgi:hypothetical protein
MVRAAACDESSAVLQEAHGTIVDFLVAAESSLEAFFMTGEGWRIQNDSIVMFATGGALPEKVENVGLKTFDIPKMIPLDVRAGEAHRGSGQVYGLDVIADVRQLEGETASVAESVQCPAAGIATGGPVVGALIEVAPCFLSSSEGNLELLAVLLDDDSFGSFFARDALQERKSFEFADLAIISEDNGAGAVAIPQDGLKEGLEPVGSLSKALYNQIVSVAIDDEAREKISFRVDAAADVRIDTGASAEFIGLIEAATEEHLIDGHVTAGEKSESDLRRRAVERFSNDAVAFILNGGDCAGRHTVHRENIAAINPEVTAPDSRNSALSDADAPRFPVWHRHNLHAPIRF